MKRKKLEYHFKTTSLLKPFNYQEQIKNMENLNDWGRNDFLSLLCLCGAQADMSISEEEVEWIKKYFGEESYSKAHAAHQKQSDYENIQALIQLKKQLYPEGEKSDEIMDNLKCLFSADGEYSAMEKLFERTLKKIL